MALTVRNNTAGFVNPYCIYQYYRNNTKCKTRYTKDTFRRFIDDMIKESLELMFSTGESFQFGRLCNMYVQEEPFRKIICWNKTTDLWKILYPDAVTQADYKKIKNKPMVYSDPADDIKLLRLKVKFNPVIKNMKCYKFLVSQMVGRNVARKYMYRRDIHYKGSKSDFAIFKL